MVITTHVSEEEAIRDIGGLLARVRVGEEVVIGSGQTSITLRRTFPHMRTIGETLAWMEEREREYGPLPAMDEDFVRDIEGILASRQPADHSLWE